MWEVIEHSNATYLSSRSSNFQQTASGGSDPIVPLQGPQIITVPQFDSRYWVLPFLDAGLNFYAGIGSNYNSTAGEYLVVGRGQQTTGLSSQF